MPNLVPSPLRDATANNRGLVSAVAQTFAGLKAFLSPIRLALFPTSGLPTGPDAPEGAVVYDSTLKRVAVHDGTGWLPLAVLPTGGEVETLEDHLESTTAHEALHVTFVPEGTLFVGEDVQSGLGEAHAAILELMGAALPGWQDITLGAGWEVESSNDRPQYRINASSQVWLRGAAVRTGGSGSPPGPLVTALPGPARPANSRTHCFSVATIGSGPSGDLEITPAGVVTLLGSSPLTKVHLDGVAYYIF